jgi:hypothetical protein
MRPLCSLPRRISARQRTRVPRGRNQRGTQLARTAGRTAVQINASQRQQKADDDRNRRKYQRLAPAAAAALVRSAWETSRSSGQPHQPGWRGSRQLFPSRPRLILAKAREDREHRRQSGLARAQGFSNSLQGSLLRCWQAQSRTPSARACAIRSYPGPEAQTC